MPALSIVYRYPTTDGPAVSLSSGSLYSAHADFVNAWDQKVLAQLVSTCLNRLRHCGTGPEGPIWSGDIVSIGSAPASAAWSRRASASARP
jgi:hypothetical protein